MSKYKQLSADYPKGIKRLFSKRFNKPPVSSSDSFTWLLYYFTLYLKDKYGISEDNFSYVDDPTKWLRSINSKDLDYWLKRFNKNRIKIYILKDPDHEDN